MLQPAEAGTINHTINMTPDPQRSTKAAAQPQLLQPAASATCFSRLKQPLGASITYHHQLHHQYDTRSTIAARPLLLHSHCCTSKFAATAEAPSTTPATRRRDPHGRPC
eukprot:jgi/Ulvmu1/4200/UM019_0179.1